MQDPIVLAELHKLGAAVTYVAMTGLVGDCDRATRRIRVAIGMTPAETRCTIMHEAAHLARDEFPTGDETDAEYEEMEAAADRWAAEKLISPEMLAWAQDVARDEREQAEMLGVDPNILQARIESLAGCAVAMAEMTVRSVWSVRAV